MRKNIYQKPGGNTVLVRSNPRYFSRCHHHYKKKNANKMTRMCVCNTSSYTSQNTTNINTTSSSVSVPCHRRNDCRIQAFNRVMMQHRRKRRRSAAGLRVITRRLCAAGSDTKDSRKENKLSAGVSPKAIDNDES